MAFSFPTIKKKSIVVCRLWRNHIDTIYHPVHITSIRYWKWYLIHTYIIGHYNPLARIVDLVFHTNYVVCVNFIHKWRDLQFKVYLKTELILHTQHNWSLQIFSQDYNLTSHTTYVVYVNWRYLQFKVDSERQIFQKLFMLILFIFRVFAGNLLSGSRRRNTFRIFVLMSDLGFELCP